MSLKEKIDPARLPSHIAIIMDGNGRWAKKKGKLRVFGHEQGVKAVRATVEAAASLGLEYLTLFAFSTENWRRPKYEVDALMHLLIRSLNKEVDNLHKNNIRLHAIGNFETLPPEVAKDLDKAILKTSGNSGLNLIIAISYSSRWEITHAVRQILEKASTGELQPQEVTDELFSQYLCTRNFPDPELLIRTSGEMRISNFLLWQIAYAELFFTNVLWPDFTEEHLFEAIYDFQNRERRFGKTSEQLNSNKPI
ncbi:MAG: isoprenyl transferase [Bacteroidales bacterium]